MICMKSILPKTKVLTLYRNVKRKGLGKVLTLVRPYNLSPVFSKEAASGFEDGFRMGCDGDSGSGQVFDLNARETFLKPPKFVLAAIHDGKLRNTFNYKEETYNLPCGSFMIQNGKRYKVKGHSQSTTYEGIFKWIKSQIIDRTITASATN